MKVLDKIRGFFEPCGFTIKPKEILQHLLPIAELAKRQSI
jgi:hypothetical protein